MRSLCRIRRLLDATTLSPMARLSILADFSKPLDQVINLRGWYDGNLRNAGYVHSEGIWNMYWVSELGIEHL